MVQNKFYAKANEKTDKIMRFFKILLVKVTIPMVLLPVILRFVMEIYVFKSKTSLELAARVW